jgi:hypothetical protein
VPGTDSEVFLSYLKESSSAQRAVLDSVLSATLDAVARRRGSLSEHDLAIIARVATDSQALELRRRAVDLLRSELPRASSFSINALVYLTKACLGLNEFISPLCDLVKKRKDFPQFSATLFDSLTPDLVVSFFRHAGIPTVETAVSLLAFGAKQAAAVAGEVADLVRHAFPNSPLLFDHASLSPQYLLHALSGLQQMPPVRLLERADLIIRVSDGASPDARVLIDAIVAKFDPIVHQNFDEKCELFGRLVEWGFANSVLRFAKHKAYCTRFLETLLPRLPAHPVFCLKLAHAALRFPEMADLLPVDTLLRMIHGCVQKREFELAAQISVRVEFSHGAVHGHASIPALLARELEAAQAPADRAALCLTLLPYALHGAWTPRRETIFTIALLMQTAPSRTDVGRALVLCAAAAQNGEAAAALAEEPNIEVGLSFLTQDVQPHFVYVAVRFLMAIAPFVRIGKIADRLIVALVAVAARAIQQPRIVVVVAQALLMLPAGPQWDIALTRGGAGTIFAVLDRACSENPVAAQLQKMLIARTGGQ